MQLRGLNGWGLPQQLLDSLLVSDLKADELALVESLLGQASLRRHPTLGVSHDGQIVANVVEALTIQCDCLRDMTSAVLHYSPLCDRLRRRDSLELLRGAYHGAGEAHGRLDARHLAARGRLNFDCGKLLGCYGLPCLSGRDHDQQPLKREVYLKVL